MPTITGDLRLMSGYGNVFQTVCPGACSEGSAGRSCGFYITIKSLQKLCLIVRYCANSSSGKID